ncbi:enoyl-CoA hydratase-related protein [Desulfogranum japonicum]|uniref:enoyl-CoA hydratase-related protein n=1 Tax=Desulfogranum japonicum TaxID=231447 RepID=UPI0004026450|nr:enoyl-CoA hydratase-related protein [Desulfogranum japonicum]
MTEYENIRFERDDAIAVVTIDRPESLNALNYETLQELKVCFEQISYDHTLGVVVLTGAGEKAFVAGADISYMRDMNAVEGAEFAHLGHSVMMSIENASQPVIAGVNGFALGGGCELALACDIRIASTNAKFGQPEVNLGIIPGFGGTQRLPRLVGKGIASELLYTGDIIDSTEAFRIGLVNRVVPLDELMLTCKSIAQKINSKSPRAIKICKSTIHNGCQMDIARANQYEAVQFGQCFASADQVEGMTAFLEKRPAKFTK